MWDQEEAQACIEGEAALKRKQVERSWVQIPVLTKSFIAKSPLNTSPSPFMVVYMIVWLYPFTFERCDLKVQ